MTASRLVSYGFILGALLVAASVAGGGVAASTATTAPADAPPATTTHTPNATATFGKWVYDVTTGNTTAITVELQHTDTAMVAFGGGTVDYAANVTVTDGNGDGQVTLLFDTAAAAGEGPVFAVRNDADGVTVRTQTRVDGDLGGTNLPVAAYVNGTKTDSVTMLVRDPLDRSTPTATPSPTPTATATASPTPDDTATSTTPGFGLVAALAALAAAALLARR